MGLEKQYYLTGTYGAEVMAKPVPGSIILFMVRGDKALTSTVPAGDMLMLALEALGLRGLELSELSEILYQLRELVKRSKLPGNKREEVLEALTRASDALVKG